MKTVRFLGVIFLSLFAYTAQAQRNQIADSLYNRGRSFYEKGNYRQAELYLHKAFFLYKEGTNPAGWLNPGITYAEVSVDRSKYKRALQIFMKLKEVATAENNIEAGARIANDLGWTYKRMGKLTQALAYLKKALPPALEVRDSLQIGNIYSNIGSIYRSKGAYDKALAYTKKSLPYFKGLNNKKSLSISLNNIGMNYKDLLLFDKALKYYSQSLTLKKESGNVDLLATAYGNLAGLYDDIGRYDLALANYQKGLEYRKKAANPSKTAGTLNNIGTLYNKLGQPERALEYYRKCLQLKKTFFAPFSLAITYKNIAARLWDLEQPDEAARYYREALILEKKGGSPRAIARSLLDLAKVKKAQNNIPAAYGYVHQAQEIADSTQDQLLLEDTSNWLGNLHAYNKDFSAAIIYYKKALEYSRSLPEHNQLSPLMNIASAYDYIHSDSALYYSRRALNIIEKERSQVGSLPQLKRNYFSQYSNFYIDMASWLLKYDKDTSEAYHLIESAKARSLTDELNEASLRIDESLPEKERFKRGQKLSSISNLYFKLDRISDSNRKKSLRNKIREKELAYAAFEHNLYSKYPQYKHLKSPQAVSLQKTQQMCDSKTAVLEYAVTNKRLIIFLITHDDVQTQQFAINQASTSSAKAHLPITISRFRKAIISRVPEDSLAILSKPIYKQLIAPFQEVLSNYPDLIIIPDSYLAYVPFEALKDGESYLVSKFNIKYAPSMSSLSLINAPRAYPQKKLLAIGSSSNAKAPLLPSSRLEIDSISKMFGHSTVLKDEDVTEENAEKMMKNNYSFIHIAAHSVIDEKNSFMSGIIFGQKENETALGDDGYLLSSEIYRLHIPSNLVVLSACKSGMGNLVRGEGMLGLQRAFFNAGASTVVVSLWDVYDRSTTKFMQFFYKSLLAKDQDNSWFGIWTSLLRYIGWDKSTPFGQTASAMRTAKLKMLHSPAYHHPVYWAPFVVVGR